MLPDLVSNPGPLTYESGDLPIALRGPAEVDEETLLRRRAKKEKIVELLHLKVYPFIITVSITKILAVTIYYSLGSKLKKRGINCKNKRA